MKLSRFLKIISVFMLLLAFCNISYQGRTDSYGGHYNRSNGTYHYHSGEYAGTGSYTKPIEEGGEPIDNSSKKEQETLEEAMNYVNEKYGSYYPDKDNLLTNSNSQEIIDTLNYKLETQSIVYTVLMVLGGVASFFIDLYTGEREKSDKLELQE